MILLSPPPSSSPVEGEESFFGELDAPQLCCGVLHLLWHKEISERITKEKEDRIMSSREKDILDRISSRFTS